MWGYLPCSFSHLDLRGRARRLAWRLADLAEPVRRLAQLVAFHIETARRVWVLLRVASLQ
jgi:hypothetical protein